MATVSNLSGSADAVMHSLIYCAEGVGALKQLQEGNEVAFLTESRENYVLD